MSLSHHFATLFELACRNYAFVCSCCVVNCECKLHLLRYVPVLRMFINEFKYDECFLNSPVPLVGIML